MLRGCLMNRRQGFMHAINRIVRVTTAVGLAFLPLAMLPAAAADGWFTTAQATSGHQFFNNQCAQCHRPDLTGAQGPALVGPTFLAAWSKQPVSALFTFEHQKMPEQNPGSVPPDQLWAITAYILQKNGFSAGATELGDAAADRVLTK